MERLGTLPFVAQPGERYVYGYNTDILGCVVEKASGITLADFVNQRITGPLGMKDTRFFIPPTERNRLAAVYASGPDGKAVRAPEGSKGQGSYVDGPRKSFAGGAGLTSTARDYARFLEMIRRGGELDGVRILAPRTAQLMTTNQSGTLHSTTGLGFGYGFETVDRYGASLMAEVGAFGWGGAYGTKYQVDPKSRMVVVLMIQQMPNSTDIQDKFFTAVYQAAGGLGRYSAAFAADVPQAPKPFERLRVHGRFAHTSQMLANLLLRLDPFLDFVQLNANDVGALSGQILRLRPIRAAVVQLDVRQARLLRLVAEDQLPLRVDPGKRSGLILRHKAARLHIGMTEA